MVEVDPTHRLLYAIRLYRNNLANCDTQGVFFCASTHDQRLYCAKLFLTPVIANKNIQPKIFARFLNFLTFFHLLTMLRPKTSIP